MKSKHTKGKWFVIKNQYPTGTTSINISTLCRIATLKGCESGSVSTIDEAEANAAFICKAVNSHDALISALKRIAAIYDNVEDAAGLIAREAIDRIKNNNQ